jgi:putative cofactor-binding repeat protein
VIENNYIEGFDGAIAGNAAIHVRGANKNIVSNNTINDTSIGVMLYVGDDEDGCYDNVISNNTINGAEFGVKLTELNTLPATGNIITGNTFSVISATAIQIAGSSNIISLNVMINDIQNGIKVNPSTTATTDENVITGNRIMAKTTSSQAIDISATANGTIITNNSISDTETAIILRDGDVAVITGNYIDNSTVNDIKVLAGENLTISNNVISNISGGIDIAAGSTANRIHANTSVEIPAFTNADATPTVNSGNIYRTVGTTAITDFIDGYEGQIITVIAESSITITDGTNIFLSGSVNFAMTDTDTLTLIQKADGKWYEISRGDNGA